MYDGDGPIVNRDDTRYTLPLDKHVGEIWLTNRESEYNANDNQKNRSSRSGFLRILTTKYYIRKIIAAV